MDDNALLFQVGELLAKPFPVGRIEASQVKLSAPRLRLQVGEYDIVRVPAIRFGECDLMLPTQRRVGANVVHAMIGRPIGPQPVVVRIVRGIEDEVRNTAERQQRTTVIREIDLRRPTSFERQPRLCVGISGGAGSDFISNLGGVEDGILATATSTLISTGDSAVAFDAAQSSDRARSDNLAIGIDAGDGDDWIENEAPITARSTSITNSTRSSFSFAGGAETSIVISATAEAAGISGGDGDDTIHNAGNILAEA